MSDEDFTLKFLVQFNATHDADKDNNPIATWLKHRAILGPREAVPVRCLEPDWLDFWATYRGGIFLDGARQAVTIAGTLSKTLQRWAAKDEHLLASRDLRAARHAIPISKASLLNKETYKQEAALRGIRLLSAGRTIGESRQRREPPSVDQVVLTKEERKARRKEYTQRRRKEDMLIREAMYRGMSLDRVLAAMKELPQPLHEMDYPAALDYVLDFDARKARDKAIFG